MKKNKITIATLGLVSLMTLCGCGENANSITREKAITLLGSIKSQQEGGYSPEYTSFMVSQEYSNSDTYTYNSATSTLDSETSTISNSTSVITQGTTDLETKLYRYSESNKYIYMQEPTDTGTITYKMVKTKYASDDKEYLYELFTDNNVNTFYKIEDSDGSEFNAYLNYVKEKAKALSSTYNDTTIASNYLTSLPETISGSEQYLSLNDKSVYLRVSGNEGASVVSKFGISGNQSLYFTRFADCVCTSSYAEVDNSSYSKVSADKFTLGGGLLTYFPVKPSTVRLTISDSSLGSSVVVTDDGEGGLVNASTNESISGSYIDYTSGEFFVAGEECKVTASYEYKVTKITYDKYACAYSDFTVTDVSTDVNTASNWTKLDSWVSYKNK